MGLAVQGGVEKPLFEASREEAPDTAEGEDLAAAVRGGADRETADPRRPPDARGRELSAAALAALLFASILLLWVPDRWAASAFQAKYGIGSSRRLCLVWSSTS